MATTAEKDILRFMTEGNRKLAYLKRWMSWNYAPGWFTLLRENREPDDEGEAVRFRRWRERYTREYVPTIERLANLSRTARRLGTKES